MRRDDQCRYFAKRVETHGLCLEAHAL
jgi:transposase